MMKKREPKADITQAAAEEAVDRVDAPDAAAEDAPCAEAVNPLAKQLEEAVAQRDEYLKLAQLSRAEFENFRRRNQTVRADALAEGAADAITALLPVLDNLERAVDAAGDDSFSEGVRMVLRQFFEVLKSQGVNEIPCEAGGEFDPNMHNAVLSGPGDEDHPAGTILNVLQKGYQHQERILRHSMVQVAQ